MSRLPVTLMLGVFVLPLAVVRAQSASGPKESPEVGSLRVFVATGDSAGQDVDFVAEQGDRPRVYLFIQAEHWNRPMARFVKTLDRELAQGIEGADEARSVAVWLTDDMDK